MPEANRKLTLECRDCGSRLLVVTQEPALSERIPFFVRCLACDTPVHFTWRVGLVKSVSLVASAGRRRRRPTRRRP